MKYVKIPFWLLWRVWFYLLVLVTVVLMSPLLLIFTSNERYYPFFWKMIRVWAIFIIHAMGFRLQITREQKLEKGKSYMICPNHTSLLDIFILIWMSKNPIVFVGKKELEKLPIFGFFYKKVVITVDRNSLKSRKEVYNQAKNKLKKGLSIAIFPEGGVPEESIILAPFKNGAFNLAIEFQIPIVPQVYYDCKRFFSWNIFKGRPGVLRAKQFKFIETVGFKDSERDLLKQKTYDLIFNHLTNDNFYMKDTLKAKK